MFFSTDRPSDARRLGIRRGRLGGLGPVGQRRTLLSAEQHVGVHPAHEDRHHVAGGGDAQRTALRHRFVQVCDELSLIVF